MFTLLKFGTLSFILTLVQGNVTPLEESVAGLTFESILPSDLGKGAAEAGWSLKCDPNHGLAGTVIKCSYTTAYVNANNWVGFFFDRQTSTSVFTKLPSNNGVVHFTTDNYIPGSYSFKLVDGGSRYVKVEAEYTVDKSTPTETLPTSTVVVTPTGTSTPVPPNEWLFAFNTNRNKFGSPDLSWSSYLETNAKSRSNAIAANNCNLGTPYNSNGAGLTIYKGYGNTTPTDIINYFFTGSQHYNNGYCYNNVNACQVFTQAAWRSSQYVGCASTKCGNTGYFVTTCLYLRPGNCNGVNYQSNNSPCGPFQPPSQ
ncbi:hypothetical protein HDU92_007495 [Lobulomyces angularis]|nr:hypothetical protein HDU92_007495 [Lobulomyces angularis]